MPAALKGPGLCKAIERFTGYHRQTARRSQRVSGDEHHWDVAGLKSVLLDDIVDTGGTLVRAATP